jgi:putative colanic acid biosynthesis glycosyltransferase
MLKKENNNPIISIITVSYNSQEVIRHTIESVLNQKFKNFEYIIIDGNSKDKTIQIVKSYESKFKNKNINYSWISQSDNGIYDAMNKGVSLAKGEWCNFMNTGDSFISPDVLNIIFNTNRAYKEISILYGRKVFNNKTINPLPLNALKYGIIMCNHQSMFFNKKLLKKELIYDLRYPIYGDYELVNRVFLKFGDQNFLNVNLSIANYLGGGISSKPTFQKRKDKFLILFRHYGLKGIIRGVYYTIKEKL